MLPNSSLTADERQLLALHQAGLTAHLRGDIDALLTGQADDFVLVNRGEISSPSRGTETRDSGTLPGRHEVRVLSRCVGTNRQDLARR